MKSEVAADVPGAALNHIRTATGDRSELMSTVYIPALAAFGGSAVGAVSTIVSGWFSGRRRRRERHHARSFTKREQLYHSFIEEASRLYADALVNDQAEIPQLVSLYTLVGRMRILSSNDVVQAAERAGHLIIEAYLSPNRTFVDLPRFIEEMDPLRDFGEACRRELMNLPAH
ncbi:hypothetical protein N2603_33030 [Bradyrhizobium huanghuaihaiense]|uniref:hypothetical protein n=1 Tax=Bradyrhizobium huanghuaihaiense TaxID=990078 RepID=UPI0021AB0923|nr:hypothetical protein [Bradyrhizobium sp. CB3035]UWU74838.1 hypothetical protein N2603_33030 [Bradyrhizobium sp. CB3035]